MVGAKNLFCSCQRINGKKAKAKSLAHSVHLLNLRMRAVGRLRHYRTVRRRLLEIMLRAWVFSGVSEAPPRGLTKPGVIARSLAGREAWLLRGKFTTPRREFNEGDVRPFATRDKRGEN